MILPALYAPLTAMMLGLVLLRGVAFEFRRREPAHRELCDRAFTLGALLQGITVECRAYAGGWWEWLSPISVLCGIGLIVGYSLVGARANPAGDSDRHLPVLPQPVPSERRSAFPLCAGLVRAVLRRPWRFDLAQCHPGPRYHLGSRRPLS